MNKDELENPEELIDKAIGEIDKKQKDFDHLSEKLGATKQQLVEAKPFVVNLYNASKQDVSLVEVVISGSKVIKSSLLEAAGLKSNIESFLK